MSFDYFSSEEEIIKKKNTVLVVARLEESTKRISIILKAWKKIQEQNLDWDLKIIGHGSDMQYYLDKASSLNLERVTFLGELDPLQYYIKSSIFLMSSRNEGWGLTLTESLQTGCVPVVMDTFPSLKQIIDHNDNGFIVKDLDLNDFTEKLLLLMTNTEKRIQMGLNGVKKSKEFQMSIIGEKWVNLFESVMH